MTGIPIVDVLLLGGRSGSGKTAVAHEVSALLRGRGVRHCHLDGDLTTAYPETPEGDAGTQTSVITRWRHYRSLGHHRLIYVDTAPVFEPDQVLDALGGPCRVTVVALTATDDTIRSRLAHSRTAAASLMGGNPSTTDGFGDVTPETLQVVTDGRTVLDVAQEMFDLTGWAAPPKLTLDR